MKKILYIERKREKKRDLKGYSLIVNIYNCILNKNTFLFVESAEISLVMVSIRMSVLFIMSIFEQSIAQNLRSFQMYILNERQFQCITTTCLPYSNVMIPNIVQCQTSCLADVQCNAASFCRSNSTCQLFDNIPSQNISVETAIHIIAMVVISGTRKMPGEYEIAILNS